MPPRTDCSQLHNGRLASETPARRLLAVLLLTGGFMFVEALGGWLSGSLALLADAGHMLTDVGAIALGLVSARIARRPADDSNTYGYLRFEIQTDIPSSSAPFTSAARISKRR